MNVGDQVGWQWGSGLAIGQVAEMHTKRVEIESKGKRIVRNGSTDDPAVVINGDNGSKVIKLAHEIQVIKGGSDVQ